MARDLLKLKNANLPPPSSKRKNLLLFLPKDPILLPQSKNPKVLHQSENLRLLCPLESQIALNLSRDLTHQNLLLPDQVFLHLETVLTDQTLLHLETVLADQTLPHLETVLADQTLLHLETVLTDHALLHLETAPTNLLKDQAQNRLQKAPAQDQLILFKPNSKAKKWTENSILVLQLLKNPNLNLPQTLPHPENHVYLNPLLLALALVLCQNHLKNLPQDLLLVENH
jgi:hypothetical protein